MTGSGADGGVLPRGFFARPARVVARALLGQRLVRRLENGPFAGACLAGVIVETEAYCDTPAPDLACHGTRNRGRPTPRTAVMFGPAGHAYVYFTYGNHWMFNVVTGDDGQANAVLVRALEPLGGEPVMAQLRAGRPRREWTNGPGKLCQALAIDRTHDGLDLTAAGGPLTIGAGTAVPEDEIAIGPRVGLGKTPEPWYSMPWRYWIRGNPHVSKYRP